MKTRFLTLAVILALFTPAFSQIKMEVSGDVVVGPHYGSSPIRTFDVRGHAFVSHVPKVQTPNIAYSGVYFEVYPNTTLGINYEDPCFKPQWNNAYRIGTPTQQLWALHSKYIYLDGVLITSDARYKTNFQSVENSLSRLLRLTPYRYDYKFKPDSMVSDNINIRAEAAAKNHIGFKAQDMLVDFPDLVKLDETIDKYSVNYIGLIPELVSALQEQNQLIEELELELDEMRNNCCQNSPTGMGSRNESASNNFGVNTESSVLHQNAPNPFTKETTIRYYIPETVSSASVYLYDMNGKQIDKFLIAERGNGQLTISKKQLSAGMYHYALIVDGAEIATKKMILTD